MSEWASAMRVVAVHNPVLTREITALHRRSMSQSPAVTAVIEALRR